jgi:hypothetical protein
MSQIDKLLTDLLSETPETFEKPSTLAGYIGVKPETVSDWAARYPEDLPSLKLPGSVRIRRCDLVAFLKKINNGELK